MVLSVPRSCFVRAVVLISIGLGACTPGDVSAPESSSPPSIVDHLGLRFRMSQETFRESGERRIEIRLEAENITADTVSGWYATGCMLIPFVAYREGEWADPVWNNAERFGQGGCAPTAHFLELAPGETEARWTRETTREQVLGDSLDAGRFRFGATVHVDTAGVFPEEDRTVEMVAPHPVWLERQDSN